MSAQDRLAITDLLYEYCEAVDGNRQAEVVDLFTEDAVYDHGHGRVSRGRAELATLFGALDGNEATSHHLSNVRISFDSADSAQVRSYLYAYHRRRGTGQLVQLWGRYVDTVVRVDGRWRIRSRALRAAAEAGVAPDSGWSTRYELIARDGRAADSPLLSNDAG